MARNCSACIFKFRISTSHSQAFLISKVLVMSNFIAALRPITNVSSSHSVTVFLAPALACVPSISQISGLSSSHYRSARMRQRRHNPDRGVSALRRSGLGRPLSISEILRKEGLPQPVLDPKRRSKVQVDPDHALYGFFNNDKELLTKLVDEAAHGMFPLSLDGQSEAMIWVCIGNADQDWEWLDARLLRLMER